MATPDLIEVRSDDIAWTVEAARADALEQQVLAHLSDLDSLPNAARIKQSLQRIVHRVRLGDGTTVIVKTYLLRAFKDRLKRRLFGPKPRIEWAMSRRLLAMGVAASHALAVGCPLDQRGPVEGYLVVHAPADATSIADYQATLTGPAGRLAFLRELAGFVRRLHDAGVSHLDLHAGNILVLSQAASAAERFLVIDLHRIRVGGPSSQRHRLAALGQLLQGLRGGERGQKTVDSGQWTVDSGQTTAGRGQGGVVGEFLEAYLAAGPAIRGCGLSERRLAAAMRAHGEERFRSRARRCLRHSTVYTVETHQNWLIYHRRDHPADGILSLWAARRAAEQGSTLPQPPGGRPFGAGTASLPLPRGEGWGEGASAGAATRQSTLTRPPVAGDLSPRERPGPPNGRPTGCPPEGRVRADTPGLELREYPPCGALRLVLRRLVLPPGVREYAAAHRRRLAAGSGPVAVAGAVCLRGPDRGRSFAVLAADASG